MLHCSDSAPDALGTVIANNPAPQQGADLLALVRPKRTIPIHHGDYGVFASPVEDFLVEVARRGLPGVRAVARGGSLPLPPP